MAMAMSFNCCTAAESRLCLAAGEAARLIYATPGLKTFTNATGGLSWETPGNWSGNALPGATESVLISAGYAVTHATGIDSIAALTINAGNSLDVSGGSLAVSGATSGGGTLSVSGGTLSLNGASSIANLNVNSGTLNGTGNLTVTNSFSQGAGTFGNTFSTVNITQATGNLTIGAVGASGAVNLAASTGTITVNGAIAGASINVQSATGVTLGATATLSASGAGNAIVLNAGTGNFVNGAGVAALTNTGGGRWLIYSADPALDVFGGLLSGNLALWGEAYANYAPASVVETGNRR